MRDFVSDDVIYGIYEIAFIFDFCLKPMVFTKINSY